jgi:hypothetical protein
MGSVGQLGLGQGLGNQVQPSTKDESSAIGGVRYVVECKMRNCFWYKKLARF